MRLASIRVTDSLPVRRFEIDDLADIVVLAGPNGVGKTRLIASIVGYLRGGGLQGSFQATLSATSRAEVEQWGKDELDLSQTSDLDLLRATFQASRRRKNWTSSLINFESDRTIQNLQPLPFSWDMADPNDEAISWDTTFGFMRDRFQDTVHSMYRMIEAQKSSIANRAVQLQRDGHSQMNLNFSDPMEPFKRIFSMLLAPKALVDPSPKAQRLQYLLDEQVYDFDTLSSGEREVVNIAFDFQLREPNDCLVFFDEPELHLHPELSFKLISTLRAIGARNQFILSTHSPDVITSSLDQSVIFLAPASETDEGAQKNQAIAVSESDETNQALRMLGQSIGIIALGKRIVLIEGEQSSLDKQTYGSILGNRYPGLVLVPSGGKHVIESFDAIYDSILSRTLWGVEFFMLCDRDSQPASSAEQQAATASGRLQILPGYHLENAFLDERVWVEAFSEMESPDSWLVDPAQIRSVLQELALSYVSYATALTVSHQLRQQVGNIDVMPKGVDRKSLDELQSLVSGKVTPEKTRVDAALDIGTVQSLISATFTQLESLVQDGGNEWKLVIPGKPLVAAFASKVGLQERRAKTLYISAALKGEIDPFADIRRIFDTFATGEVRTAT